MNKECVEVIVLVGHLETLNALLSIHDSVFFFSFLCFYSTLTLSCYSNLGI